MKEPTPYGQLETSDRHSSLEEGMFLELDFKKLERVVQCGQDLIPAVAQDDESKRVLMVGYANRRAIEYALEHGVATFWSSSRNELWIKGATSGEYLELVETRVNCEQNSILYLVRFAGAGACHTRNREGKPRQSCYYRRLTNRLELEAVER